MLFLPKLKAGNQSVSPQTCSLCRFFWVCLKIVDGEKAKLLLADAKNFPTIFTENGVTLNAPDDTKSQKIEIVSGGNLFIMFPNSGNAVIQGQPVTILFGDIALEPIAVK